MSLKTLASQVRGDLAPLYVVLADAAPLRDRALKLVVDAALQRVQTPAFNHDRFRAADPGAEAAFVAARTLPVMSPLRLVEVRDLSEGSTAFFEALVAYVTDPSPDSVVVVAGSGFPKVEKGGSNWSARVKAALKKGGRGQLVQIGDREIAPAAFASQVAKGLGKELGRREAKLLVDTLGQSLGQIEQEVRKLAVFVGEASTISAADVEQSTANLAEAVGWDLTAGLASRDAAQTLEALHRLQEGGDDPRKLLGLISWQMRELARAARLVRAGASDGQVTKEVRMRSDVLRRIRPTLASGFPDAADLLRRLATANRYMNSHRADPGRILEGMVLEMLGGTLRRPPPVPRPR